VANVTKATIDSNTITNFPGGAGISAQGGNPTTTGTGGTFGVDGDATNIITITNNHIAGASAAIPLKNEPITVFVQDGNSGSRGQGNFTISGNGTNATPLQHFVGNGISASTFGFADATWTIANNFLNAGDSTATVGVGVGTSSTIGAADTPSMTATVTGNTVNTVPNIGILVKSEDTNGTLRIKLQNNSVQAVQASAFEGIQMDSGLSGIGNPTLCANITGNTSAGGNGGLGGPNVAGIGLAKGNPASNVDVFGINGLSPSPANAAVATAFVAGNNPGSTGGVDDFSDPTNDQFVVCSLP
jgi:hypothetical protein